jgi:hypothetical protein
MEFLIPDKKHNMENERRNNQADPNTREGSGNRTERISSTPNDLPDSPGDEEKLQAEETYIDLPDVKDIPGQEFVHVPPPGEMADTTIASDDEEGKDVFDKEQEEG